MESIHKQNNAMSQLELLHDLVSKHHGQFVK
jgi:hypothetical protein